MEAKVEKKTKSSLTMRNLKSLILGAQLKAGRMRWVGCSLKSNRGVSLYLALLIMAILLSIGLGISAILFGQIKIIRGIGDSVVAFYAADTGIERALAEGKSASGVLENGAEYNVLFLTPGSDCLGLYYCLESVGSFKGTKRAIEIIR